MPVSFDSRNYPISAFEPGNQLEPDVIQTLLDNYAEQEFLFGEDAMEYGISTVTVRAITRESLAGIGDKKLHGLAKQCYESKYFPSSSCIRQEWSKNR